MKRDRGTGTGGGGTGTGGGTALAAIALVVAALTACGRVGSEGGAWLGDTVTVRGLGAERGAAEEPASRPERPLAGPPVRTRPRPPAPRFPGLDPDTLIGARGAAAPDTVGRLLARRFATPTPGTPIEDYLLYLPPGIERADRSWPVILYLHGRSLRGDDPRMLERYGLPELLARGDDLPFIVVAPQLPFAHAWTDADRVAMLLAHAIAPYDVDRSRIYLTGYSMGGGGAWRVAFDHAGIFAAAVPIAAWTPEPTPTRVRALVELPLRVYHGSLDEVAPLERVVAMVEALERAGAPVELVVVPGADHDDLASLYRDPGLYAWLLTHRRVDTPARETVSRPPGARPARPLPPSPTPRTALRP